MKAQKVYLEQLLERIERIEASIQEGEQAFLESVQIQDAVIRNFEVIGEIVKRLTSETKDKQPHVHWKKVAGLRDVLIHAYDEINLQLIWETATLHMPPLKMAVIQLINELSE